MAGPCSFRHPPPSVEPFTLGNLATHDHRSGEGLSARTVRYIHTIISAAMREAVEAGLLTANPASRAKPPTAKQAASP
jgi:hypothetical protein